MTRLVLGLNTDHGDTAAALVGPEGPIAAIAEERLSRKKHSADFPEQAIREVLRLGGIEAHQLSAIAVARDPRANLAAKAAFVARYPSHGLRQMKHRLQVHRGVSNTRHRLALALGLNPGQLNVPLHRVEHHLAHAASAYYWSEFDRAAALTVDGAGDFATALWARCEGNTLSVLRRAHWPHSLGVFYTALCQFAGFERYGEEFKVMGLSAYGKPTYLPLMRELVQFHPKQGLRLDLRFFRHHRVRALEDIKDGVVRLPALYSRELEGRLGPARQREQQITDRERDLAASMQCRYEEVFLAMLRHLTERTALRNVVLAGGCALNSVANGRMLTEGYVDRAYFQPAASDDGTAMGAAQFVLHGPLGVPRAKKVDSAYLGPAWPEHAIEAALEGTELRYRRLSRDQLVSHAASALAAGKIVGWFQGREEWGPRALGNRSILCNPATPNMKATLNARVKNREPFRPFAPIVRWDDLRHVFEGQHELPFMSAVYVVKPEWRERIPAVTHRDATARVQTLTREQNALCFDLLTEFKEQSGIPVLLNTSFNENEPIVHRPEHAIACFQRTRMDALGIGSIWVEKTSGG